MMCTCQGGYYTLCIWFKPCHRNFLILQLRRPPLFVWSVDAYEKFPRCISNFSAIYSTKCVVENEGQPRLSLQKQVRRAKSPMDGQEKVSRRRSCWSSVFWAATLCERLIGAAQLMLSCQTHRYWHWFDRYTSYVIVSSTQLLLVNLTRLGSSSRFDLMPESEPCSRVLPLVNMEGPVVQRKCHEKIFCSNNFLSWHLGKNLTPSSTGVKKNTLQTGMKRSKWPHHLGENTCNQPWSLRGVQLTSSSQCVDFFCTRLLQLWWLAAQCHH